MHPARQKGIFIGNSTPKTANKKVIDISSWDRKEHYAFFGNMPDPYFGLTVKVDFTDCYRKAKEDGKSFFLYSLHGILKALNSIPEFRYRVEDGNVVQYDFIGASPTIAREDGSFGFAYFDWDEDLNSFVEASTAEIARRKRQDGDERLNRSQPWSGRWQTYRDVYRYPSNLFLA